ncbi:hydroxyacylglutathione hydrolase [Bdellovibrio bacteriovorus]|uniref:hydroxyacylglutathione hydrolase n=1 Tax=Bdellovibrio bacteriovorus TaxID=959 RepID=UPI0021D0DEDE|nr:hydroxyacylglutathione hydrolase [Bdellovibrio bacteriovorus]UXR63364.1 hydroxyacylglutathione hydrolase [Bdellovibrio bacteriovorus]
MKTERVELLPIFDDNYVFVLINDDLSSAIVVDPGESSAAEEFLMEHGLKLTGILLTHHHADHIGGALELKNRFSCPVYAPLKNKSQIPFADHYLQEGDAVDLPPFSFQALELPGHTLGHIAYWDEKHKWLFSGDVIFGLGCGRLFEGSYDEAYASLQRIKALPPETLIYCTHEYTERNLQFCRILSADDNTPILGNAEILDTYALDLHNKRSARRPSVPLSLAMETETNPFLMARDVEQFRYLRELRNRQ